MIEEAGVEYTLFTNVVDVVADSGRVEGVILHGKSGFFAVKAKIYIDCTGDGDMAAMAGAAYEKGDADGRLQPGTLCSQWAGIDWSIAREEGQGDYLDQAIADGVFTHPDKKMPGIFTAEGFMGNGSFGHAYGLDGTDERSLTRAITDMRRIIPQYETYFKKYLKGYENMVLVGTGNLMGVRESRRFICDYMLTLQDFADRAVFPDEIGRYCYPVDIHPSDASDEALQESERIFRQDYRYKKGETYGIPYRTLTPAGFSNLLVAGRCIGCDRYMLGSVRVMPACFITGQAAGTAAAMAAEKEDVRAIDVQMLRNTLRADGVYLPN